MRERPNAEGWQELQELQAFDGEAGLDSREEALLERLDES